MNLNTQIKHYRTTLNLSQDQLAEQLFVTRQTISNWETSKNYPDIHSIVLMSKLFNVSIDKLVEGDLESIKEKINENQVRNFTSISKKFSLLFLLFILSLIPVALLITQPFNPVIKCIGYIMIIILLSVTFYYALKVEKLKNKYSIHTFKEISAFMDGKTLEEIEKQREIGKRPYQLFLLIIGSLFIGFLVTYLVLSFIA